MMNEGGEDSKSENKPKVEQFYEDTFLLYINCITRKFLSVKTWFIIMKKQITLDEDGSLSPPTM